MTEQLILVNEQDEPIGSGEKLEVHRKGLLHRAFSVFLFNDRGDYLLQRRCRSKYHSGGLWANTACGHPRVGEETNAAAERRLFEEMGVHCPLTEYFTTKYYVPFDNGLAEHELVHLFAGRLNEDPNPDSNEVEEWAWVSEDQVFADLAKPNHYAFWFTFYLQKHAEELKKMRKAISAA